MTKSINSLGFFNAKQLRVLPGKQSDDQDSGFEDNDDDDDENEEDSQENSQCMFQFDSEDEDLISSISLGGKNIQPFKIHSSEEQYEMDKKLLENTDLEEDPTDLIEQALKLSEIYKEDDEVCYPLKESNIGNGDSLEDDTSTAPDLKRSFDMMAVPFKRKRQKGEETKLMRAKHVPVTKNSLPLSQGGVLSQSQTVPIIQNMQPWSQGQELLVPGSAPAKAMMKPKLRVLSPTDTLSRVSRLPTRPQPISLMGPQGSLVPNQIYRNQKKLKTSHPSFPQKSPETQNVIYQEQMTGGIRLPPGNTLQSLSGPIPAPSSSGVSIKTERAMSESQSASGEVMASNASVKQVSQPFHVNQSNPEYNQKPNFRQSYQMMQRDQQQALMVRKQQQLQQQHHVQLQEQKQQHEPEEISSDEGDYEATGDEMVLLEYPKRKGPSDDVIAVKLYHYKSLSQNKMIADTIIDFYYKLIYEKLSKEDKKKVFVYDTNCYQSLRKPGGIEDIIKDWKKVNLFEKEYILIPICWSGHFTLFIIVR